MIVIFRGYLVLCLGYCIFVMDLFIIWVELVFIRFFRIQMASLYGNVIVVVVVVVIVVVIVDVVVGGVMVIDLLMFQFVKVFGYN